MLNNHHIEKLDYAIAILDSFDNWSSDDPRARSLRALKDLRDELKAIASVDRVIARGIPVPMPATHDVRPFLDLPREAIKEKRSQPAYKKSKQKQRNEDFERFWSAVKMKVGKAQTQRSFERIQDDVDVDLLIQKLEECQDYFLSRHGHLDYMPRPYTWIHYRRWEDEWGE